MRHVFFSIVIPLYNKAYIVERCLRSLANQTRLPDEVIVVDDGSTDESFGIVSEFKNSNPEINLVIKSQANSGVSAARNKGVFFSSYGYVCFLDADDEWKPLFLEKMERLIVDFPDALLYCLGHEIVDSEGNLKVPKKNLPNNFRGYVEDFFGASVKSSVANSSKVCVKKSALSSIGGFPEGQVAGEDFFVWIMLALSGQVACDVSRLSVINQQGDNSRKARVNSVPYPLVFFSKNKNVAKSRSLNKYLFVVFYKHFLVSMRERRYKEAVLRFYCYIKVLL